MKKNTVKLNEANLKKIVVESVRRVLKEASLDNPKESAYPLCSPKESAKRLTAMLGVIIREIEDGGEPCSLDDLNVLYGYACSVNDYFERI